MLALQVAVWGFHSLSPQTHAPRWKRRAELRGLVPRPEAQYHASALTARRKRGSGGFCSGLDSALTFNVNDVEEAVPIDAAPNWDMPPETAIKAYDYLHSLSRLADDGREIHNAPQRYSSKHWWANLKSTWGCNILAAVGQQVRPPDRLAASPKPCARGTRPAQRELTACRSCSASHCGRSSSRCSTSRCPRSPLSLRSLTPCSEA